MDTITSLKTALAGRYEIDREIGRGGMATVYLARDVKHARHVALKLLSPELGAVLGVERFLSEIRVTANLQHPNLLPLFDSGEVDGLLFYVMPFVDGESLRARLDREKQLPIDDAIRIAVAVAGALDYAHGHGVIHRDLKPENILLQHGQPVVADFGIALAVSNAGGTRVTQTGLSLGTPQYMSPEQATGDRTIDARADIYSLGAVTYEMLTGEPPHSGTTAQAIVAKLMTEDPRPITVLRRSVPPHVDLAVRHALEKLPADRFASAREFADALNGRGPAITTGVASAAPGARSLRRTRIALGAVGLLALAMAVAAISMVRSSQVSREPMQFTIDPGRGTRVVNPAGLPVAISPDGRTLAFLARGAATAGRTPRAVFVRRLGELDAQPLLQTEGGSYPVFSPDGRFIVFGRGGLLSKIAVGGGSAASLGPRLLGWAGTAWGAGDYVVTASAGGLLRIRVSDGERKILTDTAAYPNERLINDPYILPDGKTVAFRATVEAGPRLGLVSIDSGPQTILDLELENPVGYVDGIFVFGRLNGTLSAVKLNASKRRLEGAPVDVLTGVNAKYSGGASAALSASGTLFFLQGGNASELVVIDERGQRIFAADERREYANPAWSPDGTRLAVDVRTPGATGGATTDIWMLNLESRAFTRITQDGGARAAWFPDGKRISYLANAGAPARSLDSQRANRPGVRVIPVDGSRPAETLVESRMVQAEPSPDGKWLVGLTRGQKGDAIVMVPLSGDRTPIEVFSSTFQIRTFSVSPDSRWLAYVSLGESSEPQAFVRPLSPNGGRVQISSKGVGLDPHWSRDSRTVIFRDDLVIRSATLTMVDGTPVVARRDSLFEYPYQDGLGMHPDGKRMAVVRDAAEDGRLVVFTNWITQVKAKLK